MNRIWNVLFDARVLGLIGVALLAAFLFLGADVMKIGLAWAAVALVACLIVWGIVYVVRKAIAMRKARSLETALDQDAALAAQKAAAHQKDEVAALRARMKSALDTLRGSKLGQLSGGAALYELPWYLVIGNPAAGKSTAIVKSGLKFPFADGGDSVIQGIGGTRNCDWFFTSEGILVDTAGRYSVHEEDRDEWLGFLGLLKKHRPKAPINGIIIVASVADLANQRPEQSIQLAKSLRQRVQESIEKLEVVAPVYLVFAKADLIAGFTEFFEDRDPAERERVWGATFPYSQQAPAAGLAAFDERFDELVDGLKEMSVAHMSMRRGDALPPGVLTFPVEFAALKPVFRAFVNTLFEENPYQYRPVFRGFYFTSSVQTGQSTRRATDRVAGTFGLKRGVSADEVTGLVVAQNGFFLRELFSKVIFGDKHLVRQYASRTKLRLRALSFGLATLALAVTLGAWTWSTVGNRQLLDGVKADLDKVVRLQAERTELGPRLEGLLVLQDRIEQLRRWRDERPWSLSMGLYQGDAIDRRLREEYFAGVRKVMLEPASQAVENYLAEVNSNPARLRPMSPAAADPTKPSPASKPATTSRFVDASPESAADAYNALKTYLMLGDRSVIDASHLNDQLTRFWRGWLDDNRGALPREQLMRNAEQLISFTTANASDAHFPVLQPKLAVVDQTRTNLRELVRGMKGVERVYANVKARAATRYAPITVASLMSEPNRDVVAGSHAVPGTFTRDAWDGYIEKAFKEAATTELQNRDWVLNVADSEDLTLVGSPDQIRKTLTELYKTEYVREWQRFMQGLTVAGFDNFPTAVARMNRLGDPKDSPVATLMQTLFDQTSWDNPTILNERLQKTQKGFVDWVKSSILRMAPSRVEVKVDVAGPNGAIPMGPIGREFAAVQRIMLARDGNPTPMTLYLGHLSKVRTRFNQLANQGDAGPGARVLLAATLDGGASELTDALRHVDEQMLVNMTDSAKASIRPVLVRPLIEALAVLVEPTELEVNRVWEAQVRAPFERALAAKYPFDPHSRIEASEGEIGKVFGPGGTIAKFAVETLGPLVHRRGDIVEPRRWAEVGIRLRTAFVAGLPAWVAPMTGMPGATIAGGGSTASPGAANPSVNSEQSIFQVQPQGSPGISEFTLVIDGQSLRYRNAIPEWVSMVWPNPAGTPGVRINAVTDDGQSIEMLNEPGTSGLQRMLEAAARTKLKDGTTLLTWAKGAHRVNAIFRLVRTPGPVTNDGRATAPGEAPVPAVGGVLRFTGLALPALVAGPEPAVKTAPLAAKATAGGVAARP
jgi:type VI secretion system protein ImpL